MLITGLESLIGIMLEIPKSALVKIGDGGHDCIERQLMYKKYFIGITK